MTQEPWTEVALFVAPEIKELFSENNTNLVEVLQAQGLDLREVAGRVDIAADSRTKEPVTIILASAAAIALLTPAITRIIKALTTETVIVTEKVPVAVVTADGKEVFDKEGYPVIEWTEKSRAIETRVRWKGKLSAEVKTPVGFEVKIEAESRA